MCKQLERAERVDVVSDIYSLKESTRKKRGKAVYRKVLDQAKLEPRQWSLRDPNKKDLFAFIRMKCNAILV